MEESSDILWILFIAASVAIPLITKAKEKKRTAAPASAMSEDESDSDPRRTLNESAPPISGGAYETPGTAGNRDDSNDPNNESDCFESAFPRRQTAKMDSGKESDAAEDGSEEFDLKKAIVWSEILKQKFEE